MSGVYSIGELDVVVGGVLWLLFYCVMWGRGLASGLFRGRRVMVLLYPYPKSLILLLNHI